MANLFRLATIMAAVPVLALAVHPARAAGGPETAATGIISAAPTSEAKHTRTAPAIAPAATPDKISVYFDSGSASLRPQDLRELDHAARLYRDGQPVLMTVSGSSDSSGSPVANLLLSQRRADAVFLGLVARGIPATRFQILAKGANDAPGGEAGSAAQSRRAEITWK
jgi:OOP family OmpA-OmpF porin